MIFERRQAFKERNYMGLQVSGRGKVVGGRWAFNKLEKHSMGIENDGGRVPYERPTQVLFESDQDPLAG